MRTLKPSLPMLSTSKVRTLQEKAGTTPRIRGRAGTTLRQRILLRDNYACAVCGLVSMSNEADHIIPLEQGGSNAEANMQTLCRQHHVEKTAAEALGRRGVG